MVNFNAELSEQYNKIPFPIWDFSAANTITSEPFPEAGDIDTEMKYYYEAIHFNLKTGGYLLDRIYDRPLPEEIPEDFGLQLTQKDLEPTLNYLQKKQALFRRNFPADAASVTNAAQQTLRKVPTTIAHKSF